MDRLFRLLVPAAIMIGLWLGLWWACQVLR